MKFPFQQFTTKKLSNPNSNIHIKFHNTKVIFNNGNYRSSSSFHLKHSFEHTTFIAIENKKKDIIRLLFFYSQLQKFDCFFLIWLLLLCVCVLVVYLLYSGVKLYSAMNKQFQNKTLYFCLAAVFYINVKAQCYMCKFMFWHLSFLISDANYKSKITMKK